MKKALIAGLIVASLAGVLMHGQAISPPSASSYIAGRFIANSYGQWANNIYSITSSKMVVKSAYVALLDGRKIMPYSTNAPLKVGNETVTPSAVSGCTLNDDRPTICTITATFVQTHTTADVVTSATIGLQEAINDAAKIGGTVTVDGSWAAVGGTTAMISSAVLPGNVTIEDSRNGITPAGSNVSGQGGVSTGVVARKLRSLASYTIYSTGTVTNTSNAYTALAGAQPLPPYLAAGQVYELYFPSANTGAATLTIGSLSVKPIKTISQSGSILTLSGGEIAPGPMSLYYDGSEFILRLSGATGSNGTFWGVSGGVQGWYTPTGPNTLGCLDGYDHLPCTVYDGPVLSETSVTGSWATVYTTTAAGWYRINGSVYATTTSSTAYTITQSVSATQVSSSFTENDVAGMAVIGTTPSISDSHTQSHLYNLASGAAVLSMSSTYSGSNTGGAWNRFMTIERLK